MATAGTRAVETPGKGFAHLDVRWPDTPLVAGITTRRAGERAANGQRDPALHALSAWAAGSFDGMIGGRQVHGARIFLADGVAVPESAPRHGPFRLRVDGYDGFVATRGGLLLTVGVADCVPVLLYAPGAGVVALLHAGWRGVAAGILLVALAKLEEIGVPAAKVLGWWGPAIGGCCYPVGEEVVEAIRGTPAGPSTDGWAMAGAHGPRVDLREALIRQAEAVGMARGRVTVSSHCTACEPDLFFSYRRRRASGRMVAFAGTPGNG